MLVADDSLTIQKVVELTFADSDYRLTCVSNGRVALERIGEDPPDVILADVVMPEKNGYEICEEIKRNPATADIPVILLAGTFEPFDRARAERLGCDAIVSKPFDSRELYRKVEALVAGRAARSPSAATPAPAPPPERTTPPTDRAAPVAPEGPGPEGPVELPASSAFTAPPSAFTAPPSAFDAGFAEEDFTGSIRTMRAGRGEPLANLYGPEDVESALAAFREVEPTSRAGERRPTAHPSESPRPTGDEAPAKAAEPAAGELPLTAPADDGRTQRIDVSEFRPPRSRGERGASTAEIRRDAASVPSLAVPSGAAAAAEIVEPLPPLPIETTTVSPTTPAAPPFDASGTVAARELTEAELDRLAEKIAVKLVEKLADRAVREIAWEVVPETAELVVRERLRELESGAD